MVSNKYAKAFVEILECLKFIDKTEYNKIPAQIINYFENNKDINYIFKLDLNKNIMEQNLSQEANTFI